MDASANLVLDEPHLVAAFRYVALNPVRARLVRRTDDRRWSSTRALMAGESNGVAMSNRC